MDPRHSPSDRAEKYARRPGLLFVVVFFSFFLGMQTLLYALPALFVLGFMRGAEDLQQWLEQSAFTQGQLILLVVFQLVFSLVVLVSSYYLLTRLRERYRRILGIVLAADVLLFLLIALYYRHVQHRPTDGEQFYYDVFCTFIEIGLIIALSHPSIVGLTRPQAGEEAPEDS